MSTLVVNPEETCFKVLGEDFLNPTAEDLAWLQTAREMYPEVANEVQAKFAALETDRFHVATLNTETKMDLDALGISKFASIKDMFGKLFKRTNHLLTFQVRIVGSLKFNLFGLVPHLENIVQERSRIMMKLTESKITATVTREGKINVVGGQTETQLESATVLFVGQLRKAMVALYRVPVAVQVLSLRFGNFVATIKSNGSLIDIYRASLSAEELQVYHSYLPESGNLITYRPLPRSGNSTRIIVFPTGGIVATGAQTLFELCLAIQIVCTLLLPYIFIPAPQKRKLPSSATTTTSQIKRRKVSS